MIIFYQYPNFTSTTCKNSYIFNFPLYFSNHAEFLHGKRKIPATPLKTGYSGDKSIIVSTRQHEPERLPDHAALGA